MRLTELTTRSFRNLSADPVFFGAGVTLICGENAQGKSNLLEAVAAVCGQRSFRRAAPREMSADGAAFSVEATVRRDAGDERLRVEWAPETGRVFRRSEKAISFREASALAPAVFLCAEQRELVTGPPAVRRRFLDRLVLNCRPAAGADLVRYDRALKERNALLTSMREQPRSSSDELSAWTDELVGAGCAVRRHRRAALAEWCSLFRALAVDAGPEYSSISIGYVSDGESENEFRRALERAAPAERRKGRTLAGPHRDDLSWIRAGRPLASHASAGEIHRTVSLAKLAEWRAAENGCGESPLLAVDDFDAGLSPAWVEAFFSELPRAGTVLLTTASEPSRWRHRAGEVLEMRGGRIAARPRAVND